MFKVRYISQLFCELFGRLSISLVPLMMDSVAHPRNGKSLADFTLKKLPFGYLMWLWKMAHLQMIYEDLPIKHCVFSIVILVTRGYRKSNDPPIIPHSKSWLPNVANGSAVGLVGGMSEQVSQCRIGTSEHTNKIHHISCIYNYVYIYNYIYIIYYIYSDRQTPTGHDLITRFGRNPSGSADHMLKCDPPLQGIATIHH